MPKRGRRPPASRYQTYAIAFLSIVGLLAVLVVLASLGRVRVRITPRAEPIVADTSVVLIASGIPRGAELLGRLLRVDGTANVTMSVGASGAAAAPEIAAPPSSAAAARARGTVTLTNTQTNPQTLIATTRLRAPNGMIVRIERAVIVPARGTLPGVAVYADQSGSAGNIGPTRFTIPGLSAWLQARVWAESTEPMTGGSGSGSAPIPKAIGAPAGATSGGAVVAAADLEAARMRAAEAAREDAQRRVFAAANAWEQAIIVDTTASTRLDGAVGDRRPQVVAHAVTTITAIIIDRQALAAIAERTLREVAEQRGKALLRVFPDTVTTRIVQYAAAAARATITVHVEGEAMFQAATSAFDATRIVGFTPDAVRAYVKSIPGIEEVDVHLSPFWLRRVPATAGAIDVEIRAPSP